MLRIPLFRTSAKFNAIYVRALNQWAPHDRVWKLTYLSTLWESEIQIVRRLNILLPEKDQLHSHRTTLLIFFFMKKQPDYE